MICWILRFINNCRHGGRNYGKTLSVEELDIAEKKLVKIVQQEAFSSEEPLKGRFTFRDEEGIIRLKTKILRRHDDENFRCPIVLPSKHELVERMIQDYHLQLLHAELIGSLSTSGFFLGIRRFIARRGRPRVVYSDNGTNFVGARNLLRSVDWNQINRSSSIMKIQWKLNPPTAAWWGGWWERLVQMIKKLLRRVLGKALLSYEEMLTILCDAEANINSRPLTYESEDSTDLCALTPSMFIQDVRTEGVPDLDSLDKINLSKRWRYHQKLRVEFRKRFRDEYLGMLVHRPKTVPSRTIKKGDLVFVEDDKRKRTDWPMGRVIETYPGKDNNIRVVKVKTSSGELLRPVQRVFPMEIDNKESIFELKTTESSTSPRNTGKRSDLVIDTKDCELENSDKNIQFSGYGRKIVKPKNFN
ncbi:uncharacterized protein LOC118188493 [Stegodyphus dumicola]|uniref:uncharacterized protein LOC118188493 n=1 Tax=Stegodyphus dumicola TaxID=202533 RepID=UPI0015AE0543|nr:uncharacterized protein LOC118188493 [Stegodyphus dumicola]